MIFLYASIGALLFTVGFYLGGENAMNKLADTIEADADKMKLKGEKLLKLIRESNTN